METRNVKISLETAQRWYNSTDNELKELAVQTYPEIAKKELPKSWEELKEIKGYRTDKLAKVYKFPDLSNNKSANIFATKEQAEASIAMAQLSQLMKVYNDGWEHDWSDDNQKKYVIYFLKNNIDLDYCYNKQFFLSFKDEETRDLFLENFRELIEKAKPLL
jgi:hypothetical protein